MKAPRPPDGRIEDDFKYSPGVGPTFPAHRRPLRRLEVLTLVHVSVFLLATTWLFGGQADWVRTPLAWLGSIGALITLAGLADHESWREGWMRPLGWTWPILAFNALVLLACLNPSLREVHFGTETIFTNTGAHAGWPSSARPALALAELWLFDAVWLTCFNIALLIRQRRALRFLLGLAVANALVLAIFGTVQKLAHAHGLFFDLVPSPQTAFFASFVYHNHWGAFAVLMLSTGLALIRHYARRREARDFLHTPAMAGVVALLVIAATIPLSTSRSCTLLALVLFAVAIIHPLTRVIQARRRFHESIAPPLLGTATAVLFAGAAIWFVARESIISRVAKTEEQISEMRSAGTVGDRAVLYRNTWRMAAAKPWFGWGMASYPNIFTLFNTRSHSAGDNLPVFYHDAHSDWLQALAEHGFVGCSFLALAALVPLLRLRRHHLASPLPAYLLGGCALILLYAGVEFPFGNVAVVLCWWLCFFCAVQYARLQDREGTAASNQPSRGTQPESGMAATSA